VSTHSSYSTTRTRITKVHSKYDKEYIGIFMFMLIILSFSFSYLRRTVFQNLGGETKAPQSCCVVLCNVQLLLVYGQMGSCLFFISGA